MLKPSRSPQSARGPPPLRKENRPHGDREGGGRVGSEAPRCPQPITAVPPRSTDRRHDRRETVVLHTQRQPGAPSKSEPILAQGTIEKAFPGDTACTERVHFANTTTATDGPRGRFYLDRGITIGDLMERELDGYA